MGTQYSRNENSLMIKESERLDVNFTEIHLTELCKLFNFMKNFYIQQYQLLSEGQKQTFERKIETCHSPQILNSINLKFQIEKNESTKFYLQSDCLIVNQQLKKNVHKETIKFSSNYQPQQELYQQQIFELRLQLDNFLRDLMNDVRKQRSTYELNQPKLLQPQILSIRQSSSPQFQFTELHLQQLKQLFNQLKQQILKQQQLISEGQKKQFDYPIQLNYLQDNLITINLIFVIEKRRNTNKFFLNSIFTCKNKMSNFCMHDETIDFSSDMQINQFPFYQGADLHSELEQFFAYLEKGVYQQIHPQTDLNYMENMQKQNNL